MHEAIIFNNLNYMRDQKVRIDDHQEDQLFVAHAFHATTLVRIGLFIVIVLTI